jgi:HSP20 family protein
MAETRGNERGGIQRQTESGTLQKSEGQNRGLSRWDPFDLGSSPFSLFRRLHDDMDRLFAGFGTGRGWSPFGGQQGTDWTPAIETFQRGNEFVVRAEVPGLTKDDITAEIGEDALTIRGERKYDHEEEREGVFRSERAYGSFYRVIPLPEGAVADSAKANFSNGVLEIIIQAPSQEVRRGRRIEIAEGSRKEEKR